jgi:hypothetical protein
VKLSIYCKSDHHWRALQEADMEPLLEPQWLLCWQFARLAAISGIKFCGQG